MLKISDLEFEEYISREKISDRLDDLAKQIDIDYAGKNPVFLGILNGSFMFLSELFKRITIDCELSFIKVASYRNTESTGTIKDLIGVNESIAERHIIIGEDIVDTGQTLEHVLKLVNLNNPLSVKTATLLHKPAAEIVKNNIEYVGFEVENKFVVGFGLDYNGLGRNLDAIYVKV